jgi:hypothetical protein
VATKADLRRLILMHLTVIDETENPSAEQASLLDLYIDGCRAELLEKGLCWWDEDDIPAAVTLPLRAYVAGFCAPDFGRSGKGYEEGVDPARARLAALKPTEQREETRAEYF